MSDYLKKRLHEKIYGKETPVKKVYRIPKVSKKRAAQIEDDKKLFELDKIFYREVWAASPHVCEECGKKLGKEPLTLFFHHALPKRLYPEFRHTPENIVIACADHHQQAETDLDKVPKIKKRTAEIRKRLLG